MNDRTDQHSETPKTDSLVDFVKGVTPENPLEIEVAVYDSGIVALYHDKPFKSEISWLEFDLNTSKLDFIMDNGEIRDAGLPLTPAVTKYMQNAHQILTIFMDDDTGEVTEGTYIPLILHQN